jgi:hypothetical protein
MPGLHLSDVPDRVQGGLSRHRHGRCLFEGQPRRLRHHPVRRGVGVLGERGLEPAENLVPRPQAIHVRADCFHRPRAVGPSDPVLLPGLGQTHPSHEPRDVRVAAQYVPVVRVLRGGVHADQHVIGPDLGLVGVHGLQDVWGAEAFLDDCLHRCPLVARMWWASEADPTGP